MLRQTWKQPRKSGLLKRGLITNNAGIKFHDTGVKSKNTSPHHVGLVVGMSAFHAVGHRFAPQAIHSKDHHIIGRKCLPAWHACIGVGIDNASPLS